MYRESTRIEKIFLYIGKKFTLIKEKLMTKMDLKEVYIYLLVNLKRLLVTMYEDFKALPRRIKARFMEIINTRMR